MYNSILRYMLQSFFRISLGTFMNMRLVILSAVAPTALLFSIPTALVLISFTSFTYIFMQRNKKKLDDPYFQKCYGSLYVKVETFKHPEALKFSFFFCLKRLASAMVIAWCQISIVLQVFLLVKIALVGTCWAVSARPMVDKTNNFLFITNEVLILVCSYLVLLFSEFVPTPEQQYSFGYMYISLFLVQGTQNIVIFIIITIKELIVYCRKCRR